MICIYRVIYGMEHVDGNSNNYTEIFTIWYGLVKIVIIIVGYF